MAVKEINLLENLASLTAPYSKTQTIRRGRVEQVTLPGGTGPEIFLGPGRTEVFDFFAATTPSVAPLGTFFTSTKVNSDLIRIFVPSAIASGVMGLHLLKFNIKTGKFAGYVGRIGIQLAPTGTHTLRAIKAIDNGTTGWKIFVQTTNATVANSGLYMANDIAESDFAPVSGPTIPTATAPSQKAVYKLENSPFTLTVGAGLTVNETLGQIAFHNGTGATASQWHLFNYNGTITTVTGPLGITTDLYLFGTGNIATGFSGTFTQTNSESLANPTDSLYGALVGQDCIATGTATGLYLFRWSDITNGATSFPSLQTADLLGMPNEITAPTATNIQWSNVADRFIYLTNTSRFVAKQLINANASHVFGVLSNRWLENLPANTFIDFGAVTINGLDFSNGYFFFGSTTVGQRIIAAVDFFSDKFFAQSYVISPVVDFDGGGVLRTLGHIIYRSQFSRELTLQYRTSNTFTDPIFDSETAGWTDVQLEENSTPVALLRYAQFRVLFTILDQSHSNPTYVQKLLVIYTARNEISENWEGSVDNTTQGASSPARAAFRLVKAYPTSVPTLYFRAYDESGVLVASANTAANPERFEYSTNNGTSWNALGVIPNTALTTELRYNWITPPGVRVSVSLRES